MRTLSAEGIAFDVLVENLIRIKFWTVTWEKKQPDMIFILLEPFLYLLRAMNGMTINNNEYLPFTMTNQTFQEFLKEFRYKTSLKYHKVKLALIGDGRNHITAKPLTITRNNRLLTRTSARASHRVIGPKFHLITPVN